MRYTIFNAPVLKSFLRVLSQVLLKIFGWKTTQNYPGKQNMF